MPYVPGSGAQNAGYAVTYGDLGETNRTNLVNLLNRQNQDRQDKIDAQQQADAAHKFALQKYYGSQFNPDNYKTETDDDQDLSNMAGSSLKRVSELINKGASDEDIQTAANQEASNLQKNYQTVQTVKRNIETSLEGLKGDKTLAPYLGSLKKQAYIHALYTKDGDKIRRKTFDELAQTDPQQNYAGDILQNNPQLIVPGDVDYNGFLKSLPVANQKLTGSWYSSPGVKHKSAFDASWYDGAQKLVQDDKGAYKIETANEPVQTTDANGNPVQVNQIPQSVINTMQSTPGAKAKLDVATMQYLGQHNISAEPNTPAFETAKKAMVYEMLDKNAPKRISQGQDVTNSAALTKIELGYPMPGSQKSSPETQTQDVQAAFNDITDTPFVGDDGTSGNIVNGKLSDKYKGVGSTPSMGEVTGKIPLNKLPLSVRDAVANYSKGNDVTGIKQGRRDVPTGEVRVKLKDGAVVGVMTDAGQWFDVTSRLNSNIKQQNSTLPMKQKQHYVQDASKQKDPLGIL
jgi:hypothetical protein